MTTLLQEMPIITSAPLPSRDKGPLQVDEQ